MSEPLICKYCQEQFETTSVRVAVCDKCHREVRNKFNAEQAVRLKLRWQKLKEEEARKITAIPYHQD